MITVTVALLPSAHRERYALEFLSELAGLTRAEQVRHALGLLVHVGSLSAALVDPNPRIEGVIVMRKALRCVLHLHHYVRRHNAEAAAPAQSYFECTRCGTIRDIPYRPPASYVGM
ncbi:MAG TPA: hypothetical protein VN257_02475 [Actinotalea sp.]|nr:hypothetical protein [Actinotalea sp.]